MTSKLPRTMSKDVRSVYDHLWQDVVELHFKWKIIGQLYFDPEAVRTLNDSAPSLFNVIYGALYADFILSVSRLTDPAKQGRFENVSFDQLVLALRSERYFLLAKQVSSIVRKSDKRIEDIRVHRDKRLSHSDRDVRNGSVAQPPALLISKIERVLKDFRCALHLAEDFFMLPQTTYDHVAAYGDGSTLIWLLQAYKNNRTLLRERGNL